MNPVLAVMILSGSLTVVFTPIARRLAFVLGAVDHPGGRQKIHEREIPRLGGMVIFFSVVLSLAVGCVFFPGVSRRLLSSVSVGLFLGSGCIFLLGVYDDIRGADAPTKLVFQVAAGCLLYFSGVRILAISTHFGGWRVDLGLLSLPFTVLWLVGLTNAMNLVDGIDGLAAGVSAIAALTILLVALQNGVMQVLLITAALLGSLLVFLLFNFHPARIYLGDCGAMLLGFLLAAISVLGNQRSASAVALGVPIIALGIPILDTLLALVRRLLRGKHPFQGDREHLHHRLLGLGLSQPQAAILLYAASAFLAVLAALMAKATRVVAFAVLLCLGLAILAARQLLSTGDLGGVRRLVRSRGGCHRASLVQGALPELTHCDTEVALRRLLEELRRDLGFERLRVQFEAEAAPPALNGTAELSVGRSVSLHALCSTPEAGIGWSRTTPILLGERIIGEVAATKRTRNGRGDDDNDDELLRVLADRLGQWFAAHQPEEHRSPLREA